MDTLQGFFYMPKWELLEAFPECASDLEPLPDLVEMHVDSRCDKGDILLAEELGIMICLINPELMQDIFLDGIYPLVRLTQ